MGHIPSYLLRDKDFRLVREKISVGMVARKSFPPSPNTFRFGIISPMNDLGICPVRRFEAEDKSEHSHGMAEVYGTFKSHLLRSRKVRLVSRANSVGIEPVIEFCDNSNHCKVEK